MLAPGWVQKYGCTQSANSISRVLFVDWLMHQRNYPGCQRVFFLLLAARSQKTLSLIYTPRFKVLSTRKLKHGNVCKGILKTLFQKYKLKLTTSIQACIDHAFVNIREFMIPRRLMATKTMLSVNVYSCFFNLFGNYSISLTLSNASGLFLS